ncbi:MAG: aminotransferase class I/II-fold pyridoxal phosphate-dependent enzyme [Pseudomonadota bacterium]
MAAINDDAFQAKSADHNDAEQARVSAAVEQAGFKTYPSVGNFVLIEFPETPGRTSTEADAFLRDRGVVIRNVNVYGLPTCLRASIGTSAQNDDLIAGIEAFAKS